MPVRAEAYIDDWQPRAARPRVGLSTDNLTSNRAIPPQIHLLDFLQYGNGIHHTKGPDLATGRNSLDVESILIPSTFSILRKGLLSLPPRATLLQTSS